MAELGKLEAVYQQLPRQLQNALFSAWGLRARRQRFGGEFRRLLAELQESDFDDWESIRSRQTERLERMLNHAFHSVPFYRDIARYHGLRGKDFSPEHLERLPLLHKQAVRESPARFISETIAPSQLVDIRTSGTTGSPLTIYQTKHAVRFQWAVWWRHKTRFGIKPGEPFLTFGARIPALGSSSAVPWRENLPIRQTYLVSSLLTGRALDRTIDMIRRRRFAYYTGYPSAMYVLARVLLDRAVSLETPPRMVFTGSDALTPTFRRVIEMAFAAPVSDNFGSAEMCGNLSQCPEGKYHVDHELGIIELLPVEHTKDSSLRRLVCTGLVNLAMPLIRYDLGDYGRIGNYRCSCGRSSPVLSSVEGRTEDFIRTPDGRLVSGLNQVLEWVPELIEAQIRQTKTDSVDVLFVTKTEISDEQRSVLLRELRKRVGEELVIRLHRVEVIPRLANGKFKAVVSLVEGPGDWRFRI
jgi:phenylacetate-CoA ligase